jgi:hypothetical protein
MEEVDSRDIMGEKNHSDLVPDLVSDRGDVGDGSEVGSLDWGDTGRTSQIEG